MTKNIPHICIIVDCGKLAHSVKYRMCRYHYRKLVLREAERRNAKILSSPELKAKRRLKRKEIYWTQQKGNPEYLEKKAKADHDYWLANKEKLSVYRSDWWENRRFSGNRKKVLVRDGNACTKCGMSQKLHKKKWGTDLHVHHINGLGRGVVNDALRDNRLKNLIALCKSCHVKADIEIGKIKPWEKKNV